MNLSQSPLPQKPGSNATAKTSTHSTRVGTKFYLGTYTPGCEGRFRDAGRTRDATSGKERFRDGRTRPTCFALDVKPDGKNIYIREFAPRTT